jgi:hypothetical protein
MGLKEIVLIQVAELSKAQNVFESLKAETVDSNPTQDMDVCLRLFCVRVVLCR